MTDLVRSAVLTNYATVAQSVGIDPYQMVLAAGLSPACLSETEMRIPAASVRGLLEASAAASGTDNFGLRMAQTRKLSTMGLVGAVTRDAPTLRQALEVMTRYMRAHNESLYLTLDEEGGYATIRDDLLVQGEARLQSGPSRQSIELSIGALTRIIRVLLGDTWVPERVYFAHSAPSDLSLHRALFQCRIEFGHDFNGLVCHQRDLDKPIASSDPILAKYAQAQLESTAFHRHRSAVHEVRHLASLLMPTGRCSIEQVARHLGVDRRTVHRQLSKDHTTFTELVQQLRAELSDQYLADPTRALSDVALLLGFSGQSAYAKWHGQTFRQTARQRRLSLRSAAMPDGPR